MIKYRVNQRNVETPTLREGSSLSVYDKEGRMYRVSLNAAGDLQIATMEGELHVVPQCSNMIILKVDGKD